MAKKKGGLGGVALGVCGLALIGGLFGGGSDADNPKEVGKEPVAVEQVVENTKNVEVEPSSEPEQIPESKPVPEPEPEPSPKPVTESKSTATPALAPEQAQTDEKTVYITNTGKRYHYDSTCNGGTYFASTLTQAQKLGLTPCQKCAG